MESSNNTQKPEEYIRHFKSLDALLQFSRAIEAEAAKEKVEDNESS